MSYTQRENFLKRACRVRSVKSLAQGFLLGTMAGQKLFLHNESLPRVVNISFNERSCMFRCRMCPYHDDQVRQHYKQGSEMEFSTLTRLVDCFPNDPYYSFDISAIGETLEYEPLADCIAYMKRTKPLINVILSTNGVLLNEERFLRLADSGIDSIQVSLFAENAKDHKYITGSSSYERVRENLLAVTALKKSRGLKGPFIQTFLLECKENSHTARDFLDFWSAHVDKAFIRPMYNASREIPGMTPTFEETPPTKRYPCIMPWYATALRSNGEILPCYGYHWHEEAWTQAVGNIREQTLQEIWASEPFRRFRADHLALRLDDYPVCQKCNSWSAYTNVWKQNGDGRFHFDPVRAADFLRKAPGHRGG